MKDSVGVYYPGQDFVLEPPAFFVDRETARQWLRDESAWSIHHGRDIALSPELEQQLAEESDGRAQMSDLDRQQSQVMGETVMRANAERERWAVRMTRSWHPRIALVEHLRSLRRFQHLNDAPSSVPVSRKPQPTST